MKFQEIADKERLEETTGSEEINEEAINSYFAMAKGVALLRQRGRV